MCTRWSFSHPCPSGLIRLQICTPPTTTNFNTIIIIIPTIIIVISRTWSSSSGLRRLQIFTHIRKREDDGIVKRQKNTVSRIKTSNLLPQAVPRWAQRARKISSIFVSNKHISQTTQVVKRVTASGKMLSTFTQTSTTNGFRFLARSNCCVFSAELSWKVCSNCYCWFPFSRDMHSSYKSAPPAPAGVYFFQAFIS